MRKFLSNELCDEYEAEQLNPVYTETSEGDASHEEIIKVVGSMPEESCMRARIATFEAIVDEVIEQAVSPDIENPAEHTVTTTDVAEVVDPIVDKAVALHIVPPAIKKRIPSLIAKHLKTKDPRTALLAKVAHFVMEAETDCPESTSENIVVPTEAPEAAPVEAPVEDTVETPVETPVEETPAEEPSPAAMRSIRDVYNAWRSGKITEKQMEAEIKAIEAEEAPAEAPVAEETKVEETGVAPVTTEEVTVSEGIPEEQAAALKYLASSAVNHRSATVAVSRKFTGAMLADMLHELRYCLPNSFVQKYNVK